MIFEESLDVPSGLIEQESFNEVRKGRKIWWKRIVLSKDDQDSKNSEKGSSSSLKKTLNILFIHGSCAASSQYDDLIIELRKILVKYDDDLSPFTHSHGVSQTIKLVNDLSTSEASNINGLIFAGGSLKGGPVPFSKDGGHWIFKLPLVVLKLMQPSLSEAFAKAAIKPKEFG